jgi:hypothetical protein
MSIAYLFYLSQRSEQRESCCLDERLIIPVQTVRSHYQAVVDATRANLQQK